MIRRFGWLPVVLLALAACTAQPELQQERTVPNIILIMADDLGYETLGINGSTSYETPNLDALGATGMRFTHAYSTPLCTPSRVQIMTGKYSFRNYIGFGMLDSEEQTFGHHLQEAGYATAIFGKWQLYGNQHQRELVGNVGTLPEDAGFDEHYLWQVQEKTGPRFKDPHLVIQGSASTPHPEEYGPDVFADSLIGFMTRHQDSPFFAYYPMVLTHDPFQPTPLQPEYASFDSSQPMNDTTYFAANMKYMDVVIGRIVDALDALELRDNTLVLFTGDNGTDRDVISSVGAQRIRGHKGYPTRAGTHVPLIANWPGTILPGQVNNNLVDFTDFLPTLLDAAHTTLPTTEFTDGVSFYPQLLQLPFEPRAWVFCHYAPNWGRFEPRRYVHDKQYKLFANGEFYDMDTDPMQETPLTDETLSAEAAGRKLEFEQVLQAMR